METLILSCGTGGGHDSAARAVADELTRRGNTATILNPYTLESERTTRLVNDTYIQMAQTAPRLFGAAYRAGERYRNLSIHSPVYHANGKLAEHLGRYLQENRYHAIVATHMYPAQILANLKAFGVRLPPTVSVATDYTCIPFMEETDCDYCVIPSLDLCAEFHARGFPLERLLPYGIPVRSEFTQPATKGQARARLGLEQTGKYILLSGGSIGAGKLTGAVRGLLPFLRAHSDCRLLTVCGTNRQLLKTLERQYQNQKQVALIGYTNRMADYLKACDLFISKPGGLSSTEAAVCGVPLIHISPIPGCETHNAEFFSSREMSLLALEPERELGSALEKLTDTALSEHMIQAQKCFVPDNAAGKLCDWLERLAG